MFFVSLHHKVNFMLSLVQQLNKVYFWDVNFETLNEIKSKRLIIERVLCFGNLNEIKLLIHFYGNKEIINTICKLNYIDPKTLNFLMLLFNLPKKSFRCCTKKQSIQKPWN